MPKNKFISDKYLLTTSFNSFVAVNFNLSKSQIVMMKMKGETGPDTLLIALYVSREEKVDIGTILAVLENGGTWQQIIASGSAERNKKTEDVFRVIASITGEYKEAVTAVTDELLQEYFKMKQSEIEKLRQEGASGRELVLVKTLAVYSKRKETAAAIMVMYRQKKKSWSEIANFLGFTPKETGKLLVN